ncbi:MAG: formylglycine-generating enzyme family protein [Treponema sp.]|jgi:formylglycine-generating enzyme required for sulfatase activity|nr:formylglycine-generating enzyme family protein [Treponema sp.]
MAAIPAGTVTGAGSDGVFITGRNLTMSAFTMAKYETTYQLWKEVYDWAATKGYTFANAGKEGYPYAGSGEDGTGTDDPAEWTAAERKSRPVTMINWRDAIVWRNAYSELTGKQPVYYTDSTYGTVLKVSTDDGGNATAADTAVMKSGANGYRLPTGAEWEYAARGGNQGDSANWGYTYAGSETEGDVAWYDVNAYDVGNTDPAYGARPAGTKDANSAVLYDLSGNVFEWCWDWSETITSSTPADGAASGSNRVMRGGCWYYGASSRAVAYRDYACPDVRYDYLGFRVVCP